MTWIANVRREHANSFRLNLPYLTMMGAPLGKDGRPSQALADGGYVGIYRTDDVNGASH